MESGRVKGWNWKCRLSLALGSHQMGDLRSLSRHRVGAYPETSSHATCQGTFGHCRLSSLSHCGLILISGGKWIVEHSPQNPLKRWESHYQVVGQQREIDNENSVWLDKNTYFFVTSQFLWIWLHWKDNRTPVKRKFAAIDTTLSSHTESSTAEFIKEASSGQREATSLKRCAIKTAAVTSLVL